MKTLKEYIIEGILDIEDNIENLIEKVLIEDFIKENYNTTAKIQIKKNGNKYIVSTKGFVEVKNNNITELANGLFEWGEVKSFSCRGCASLKSLEGAPKKVGASFDCSNCISLESVKGAPKEVGLSFDCGNCKSLKDLKGAPENVGGHFFCGNCKSLKDLKGAPEKVDGYFFCNGCTSLKSLEGAPEKVRNFSCNGCTSLKSLKGAPKEVELGFTCVDCGKKFTEEDVRNVCDVTSRVIYV